ncbi:hypothetical protein ACU8V3_17150 [Cobetia marina]
MHYLGMAAMEVVPDSVMPAPPLRPGKGSMSGWQ